MNDQPQIEPVSGEPQAVESVSPQAVPALSQIQQELDDLLQKGVEEFKASQTDEENSTKRLYNALDAAYQIYQKAKDAPEAEYKAFLKSKLGKFTLATTKSPFVAPLRLIFGSDKSNSPHRARYNLALQGVFNRVGTTVVNAGDVASLIQSTPGKVDGLVAAAKEIKAAERGALPNYGLTDQEAVLRNLPTASFHLQRDNGLRLLLVNVGEDGVANVLSEWSKDSDDQTLAKPLAAAVEAAAKDRYRRMTPIAYVGSKHRQLRVIDRFLPTDISEFREPFVGSGAVFLFTRKALQDRNIKFWINDGYKPVYNFWKQIQDAPDAFRREAQKIIDSAGGNYDKANDIIKELKEVIISGSQLESAAAYFVSKTWAYGNKDEAALTSPDKLLTDFRNQFNRIADVVHPLLDGVKITNLDYHDVLTAPPVDSDNRGVLVFCDPPYDDQEVFYKSVLGRRTYSRPEGLSNSQWKELQWQEYRDGHLDFAINMGKCPYRWMITHSATKLFRLRTFVLKWASENQELNVFEHVVQSGFRNGEQREVLLSNFRPNEPSALDSWLDAQYEDNPNDPINWDEVWRQIVAGEGQEPPQPSVVALMSPFDPAFEEEWERRNGGTVGEVAERIKAEAWEAYRREHPEAEIPADAPRRRRGRPKKVSETPEPDAQPKKRGRPKKVPIAP